MSLTKSSVVHVCRSVCLFLEGVPKWPLPMMQLVTWNHPRHGPSPSHPHGNLTIKPLVLHLHRELTIQGPTWICSNLFTLKHGLSSSARMPFDWNAFLFILFVFFAVCTEGYSQSSAFCGECLKGSYKNDTGNHACLLCPAGSYNNASGQTFCTSCESGFYSPEPGLEQCLSCSGNVNDQNTDCGRWNIGIS